MRILAGRLGGVARGGARIVSGPKGGSYSVVSAVELERRALRAARDRCARAVAELDVLAESLAALGDSTVPARREVSGDSLAVAAAAASAEAQLEQGRARLTKLRLTAAMARNAHAGLSIDFLAGRRVQASREGPAASAPAAEDVARRAERAVAEAALEVGAEHVGTLLVKLHGVRASTSETQAGLALDDLRQHIDGLRKAHREAVRRAREREEILSVLDGHVSEEARGVRARVEQIRAGDPVPVTLEYAQRLASRDEAAQDAAFVEQAVKDSLTDLGYEVDGSMGVTVAADGVLLDLPGHDHYAARLRQRGGQLQYNVIRLGGRSSESRASDERAEIAACEVFEEVYSGLAEAGIDWRIERRDPVGATPVQTMSPERAVSAKRSALERRRRRPAVQRQREIGP